MLTCMNSAILTERGRLTALRAAWMFDGTGFRPRLLAAHQGLRLRGEDPVLRARTTARSGK